MRKRLLHCHPFKVVHGSLTAYSKWGCRCDVCKQGYIDSRNGIKRAQPRQNHHLNSNEAVRLYQADRRKTSGDVVASQFMKCRYGITRAEYDKLLASQQGKCLCCGIYIMSRTEGHLDHEHSEARDRSKVRGIICRSCNLTIGALGNSLDEIRARATQILSYLIVGHERTQLCLGL